MSLTTWARSSPVASPAYQAAAAVVNFWRTQKLLIGRRKTERMKDRQIEEAIVSAIQYIRECGNGGIAEFGVYNGRYAKIECREMTLYSQTRDLHLFDSFCGHPDPTPDDQSAPEVRSGTLRTGAHHGCITPSELLHKLENIYKGGQIHVHEGFFADTLSGIPPMTKFAMIVLDANLYSSSRTVLDYIFSHGHVSDGAIFLLPGWNLGRASPNDLVRRAWGEAVDKFAISFSDEGRYYAKGAKFIVHSYEARADRSTL